MKISLFELQSSDTRDPINVFGDFRESSRSSDFTTSGGAEGNNTNLLIDRSGNGQGAAGVTIAARVSSFSVDADNTFIQVTPVAFTFGLAHDRCFNLSQNITDASSIVRGTAPSRHQSGLSREVSRCGQAVRSSVVSKFSPVNFIIEFQDSQIIGEGEAVPFRANSWAVGIDDGVAGIPDLMSSNDNLVAVDTISTVSSSQDVFFRNDGSTTEVSIKE